MRRDEGALVVAIVAGMGSSTGVAWAQQPADYDPNGNPRTEAPSTAPSPPPPKSPRPAQRKSPYADLYGAPPPPPPPSGAVDGTARSEASSSSVVGAGLYPAARVGYSGGEVASSTQASAYEADGPAFEPHLDGILTLFDTIGLGVSAGYLSPITGGQSGVTLGGEAMLALSRRIILRAMAGAVLAGKVTYGPAGTDSYEAGGTRLGGGLFFIVSRSSHLDVAAGLDVLHISGTKETKAGEALTYEGTGGFIDLAMTFVP